MKFPAIHDDICPGEDATTLCPDSRCTDPAFASAHPELCGSTGKLILKPGAMVLCAQNELQFAAFLSGDNGEQPLTAGVTYASTDTDILTINASTGLATVVGTGVVVVTATWQNITASSTITIVGGAGDCCTGVAVRAVVLLDISDSMKQQPMAGPWSTRYAFAYYLWKYGVLPGMSLRTRYHPPTALSVGDGKNYEALVLFGQTPGLVEDWAAADVPGVPASPDGSTTDLAAAFQFALDLFGTVPADDDDRLLLKTIIVLSDGNNRPQLAPDAFYNLLQKANDFRIAGGVVVGVGLRASGDGFTLMKELADSGFFINAGAGNYSDVLGIVQRMMCGLCAATQRCDPVTTLEGLIPALASNTAELKCFDQANEAMATPADVWKMMDGDVDTYKDWMQNPPDADLHNVSKVAYDFGIATTVVAWRVKWEQISMTGDFTGYGDFLFLYGSNDGGATWTQLDEQVQPITHPDVQEKDSTFILPAPVAYKMYGFLVGPGGGDGRRVWVLNVLGEIEDSTGCDCDPIDAGAQLPDPLPLTDIEA